MQNFTDAQVSIDSVAKEVYCRWPLQLYVPLGDDNVNPEKSAIAGKPLWIKAADGLYQGAWCYFGFKGYVHQSNGLDFSGFIG